MRFLSLASSLAVASAFTGPQQVPLGPNAHPSELDIPLLGFGTWNLRSEDHNASKAVQHAIEVGYRHIDCAAIYGNEPDVGRGIEKGIKAAGIKRKELWVTSKLWNDHHGIERVPKALKRTLQDLRVDYLDLYLMHWPVSEDDGDHSIEFIETWKALESLVSIGAVRHIGVSNFSPSQLRELLKHSRIKPYAHQMELHPYLPQSAWLQYHHEQGIHVTAYSPLGNMNPTYGKKSRGGSVVAWRADDTSEPVPKLIEHPTLLEIADKRQCTPARVALTWGMTRGSSVIPKSQHKEYIEENFRPCFLEYEDIRALQRIGMANLTRFNNPSESWGVDLYEGLQDV